MKLTMRNSFRLGTAIVLLSAVHTVQGFNLTFLKFSPVREFTEQDWEMAKAATKQVLEDTEVGKAVSWKNPDSGNSGEVKIIKAYQQSRTECKEVQIINRTQALEGAARYGFCKQSDGVWKVDNRNVK